MPTTLLLFVLSAGPCASRGMAQMVPVPVPPPPVSLNVPQIPQRTPVWCWLAVAEMAVRYRNLGRGFSQCQMMEIGYWMPPGHCCAQPAVCARTGGLQEIQAVMQRFGGRLSLLGPPPDVMTLHRFLRDGNPVIAAIQNSPFGGHVVLIRGMRFAPAPPAPFAMGPPPIIPMVLVNDPMAYFPSEVPYQVLRAAWSAAIVVL